MSDVALSILSSLGYKVAKLEDVKEEDFNAAFHKSFIGRDKVDKDEDLVKGIIGKRMGSLEVAAKRAFGLKDTDIAGKKLEEVFDLAATTFTGQINELNTKLETAGKGKADDATLKQVEELKKAKEQLEEKLTNTVKEYDGFKIETTTKLKTTAIGNAYESAKGKILWADTYTTSPIVQNGFDATLKSKYDFDTDDAGAIVVKHRENGKLVDHPKLKDKYASLQDVVEMEAASNKLVKLNGAKTKIEFKQPDSANPNTRKMHPNAVKKAAELGA